METIQQLLEWCETNDQQSYRMIRHLKKRYDGKDFELEIYHIQGSVGANPASHAAIHIPFNQLKWPREWFADAAGRRGAFDAILRMFGQILDQSVTQNRGSDGSGSILIVQPGQKVLERNTIRLDEQGCLEIRITLSFAGNRQSRFLGKETQAMLVELFQTIEVFIAQATERLDQLKNYVQLSRTHAFLQSLLYEKGWVAFIMNGASLPRLAGDDDRPLHSQKKVTAFQSPPSLEKTLELPDGTTIMGMVIPEGITLITGGGFHGKSTLLQALTHGIYPHIPGDGREMVVTRNDAMSVCAEDGRSVRQIDISPFIRNLPNTQDTHCFSTDCASGSTSQAASIRENIDAGSRFLLFDEDRTATNFMVRDTRILQLIGQENEPIQPLAMTVRPLWEKQKVASVLVVGGLGDFLEVADVVIAVKRYCLSDVSEPAKQLIKKTPTDSAISSFQWDAPPPRWLSHDNFNPLYYNQRLNINIPIRIKPDRLSAQKLEYGMDLLDLQHHEQLIDQGQTLCLGFILLAIHHSLKVSSPQRLDQLVEQIFQEITEQGLDGLPTSNNVRHGFYTAVRDLDIYAAINRLRSLSLADEDS